MSGSDNIAGVILAGGRSSRMGKNKAVLPYKGQPLIEHASDILAQTGISSVYVSGVVDGYKAIPDKSPFNGPAHAMREMICALSSYSGVLFIPVDMPLLNPDLLNRLLSFGRTACFKGHHLPAVIYSPYRESSANSVHQLLQDMDGVEIDLPEKFISFMANVNTQEDWDALER